MFQNIRQDLNVNQENIKENKRNLFANVLTKNNIILYILTLMISTVGIGEGASVFSLSIVAACLANNIPAIGIIIFGLIGNFIGFGVNGVLKFIITLLILMVSMFIFKPVYNEENRNEKIKLGKNIFLATLVVNLVQAIFTTFTIYDAIVNISLSIIAFVFYKIFVNSIVVIQNIRENRAFSIEEVIGASLLIAIAVASFGDLHILGFSIKNILSILVVLILGWKNGILIGTASGVTIGTTLGVITGSEPMMIAAYAISGMFAGILNKFGKIGVIVGFVLGTGLISYISTGDSQNLILFKEILIASIGLLAVPKTVNINIEEFIDTKNLLPIFPNRALNKSKEAVNKLNTVSDAIQKIANSYEEVAATTVTEEDIIEKNKQIFITELLNELDNIQENMLYDDLQQVDGPIINDIFKKLVSNQQITRKDLLKIFADHNNYIIGFDDDEISKYLESNIQEVIKTINYAYKISKNDFIWTKKLEEKNKNIQTQLGSVSKAISNIAENLEEEMQDIGQNEYQEEKKQITLLLKQREIYIEEISIHKKNKERYLIDIYLDKAAQEVEQKQIEGIEQILTKVLAEPIIFNYETQESISFYSEDKYKMTIGTAKAIKNKSEISGDNILQIKLRDGKYLIAISDGMGSGKEANYSSKTALIMLENLLKSGFNKEESLQLINTSILNTQQEIFATLDISIIDLYSGTIEFIKSGAAPTYIKNKKQVQLIKSISLPTGIINNVSLTTYDKDIENGEILVMCSDGIIDSNVEYKNKELWLKYLLEDMETTNPQKIADLSINEAIDNNYGIAKDDMSIIVCKFVKI